MITEEAFRRAALDLPRVVAVQVLGATEFRLRATVFATLNWPEPGWAVVRLSPTDQAAFLSESAAIRREPTRRRDRGVTRIWLGALDPNLAPPLLQAAWRHVSDLSHR